MTTLLFHHLVVLFPFSCFFFLLLIKNFKIEFGNAKLFIRLWLIINFLLVLVLVFNLACIHTSSNLYSYIIYPSSPFSYLEKLKRKLNFYFESFWTISFFLFLFSSSLILHLHTYNNTLDSYKVFH